MHKKLLALAKPIIIGTVLVTLTGCMQDSNQVASNSWFNLDRRTPGTMVDDQSIAIKANLAIAKNKKIWQDSHISMLSYNNSLLLVGQTKSYKNKEQIEKLLEPIAEIGNIYNQISVTDPIPLKVRANDAWITTQVKAKLLSNRDVGMNRVKVLTEDGTVYLMGMLTRSEEQTASDLARRVAGVNKVITVVERVSK